MIITNTSKFKKGWFIGNFEPSLFNTDQFEVALKEYIPGDYEPTHYHKVATEYTVIITGIVIMNDEQYFPGDIIIMEPGEVTDFSAVTEAKCMVVKVPCVQGDKYND
jgi:anti-sigma factor ChrR (cupin superfamily)